MTTVYAYVFDSQTKEYTGRSVADEDQLNPGNYLLPRNSTFLEAPETEANEIAVYHITEDEIESWTVEIDFREKVLFSTSTGEKLPSLEIGDVVPPDCTEIPRPSTSHTWNGADWGLTQEAQLLLLKDAVTAYGNEVLDTIAKSWRYNDIGYAVSYVGDENPKYNAEALALKSYRSQIWTLMDEIEAEFLAGNILFTTLEEAIELFPTPPARPTTW